MNKCIFLLLAILLTGCGRKNITTPPPLPETKEITITDNSIPVMVLKMERISNMSFSTKAGTELIKLYVRSINTNFDSVRLHTIIKATQDSVIYSDTNKVYNINVNYQFVDSFYSTRYNNTIDIYTAVSTIIKKSIDKTGIYKGFAEIFSTGNTSYYKQFECDVKADNKVICTISNDTLQKFEGYIFNDSMISGKFYSDKDSVILDYNNASIKLRNDSVIVNIDFTVDSNSIFNHLKLLFNGKK